MRWIARRLWWAILIRPWFRSWRRQPQHTWLETACCRAILMGQHRLPVGSPNYFVGSEDNNGPYGAPADALTLWKFHYDPMTPGNSTFMLTNTLPTTPFNSILAPMRWHAQLYPAARYRQSNRSSGLSAAAPVSACISQLWHARIAGH